MSDIKWVCARLCSSRTTSLLLFSDRIVHQEFLLVMIADILGRLNRYFPTFCKQWPVFIFHWLRTFLFCVLALIALTKISKTALLSGSHLHTPSATWAVARHGRDGQGPKMPGKPLCRKQIHAELMLSWQWIGATRQPIGAGVTFNTGCDEIPYWLIQWRH